jgi:hypothetical protein
MHANGDDEPIGKPESGSEHIDMAVGERVERAGIESGAGHFAGLAASAKPRNAGTRQPPRP